MKCKGNNKRNKKKTIIITKFWKTCAKLTRNIVTTEYLATKAPRHQGYRIILYYSFVSPDKSGLKLMKKLRYLIYIYLFFGSLCQFDFAHGREPVERLGG